MKKLFSILAVLTLAVVLAACGKKETKVYFAQSAEPAAGFVYYVVIEKQGDKIVKATWNGYHIDGAENKCGGLSKYECSKAGKYGMNKDLTKEWYAQADKVTKWVVDNNSLNATFNDKGQANEISGATIHSNDFFDLAKKAVAANPVEKGSLKDGFYYVEGTKAKKVYKATNKDKSVAWESEERDTYTFGTFVVVNGKVVLADFNTAYLCFEKDADGNIKMDAGKPKPMYLTKDSGKEWYGMGNAENSKGEWYLQAQRVEKYLLEKQGLDNLAVNDKNKSDDIANVSITVNEFKEIWTTAKTQMSK